MLRDRRPHNQAIQPEPPAANALHTAESVVREALEWRGLSFQKSVWEIACDSVKTIDAAIENYLIQSNIEYKKILNVTAAEHTQLEVGSIGISPDKQVHVKSSTDQNGVELTIAFEFTSQFEVQASPPAQLTLLEFWRKMSNAQWLVDSMKAGIPGFRSIVLVSFLINVLALAPAIFSIQVYDRIIPNQAFASLWALGVGVLICLSFELILKKSRHQLLEHAATVTDTLCTKKLSAALLNTKTSSTKPSILLQHLRSFESLREVITGVFLLTVVDVPFLLIFLVVIALVHPLFLLLSVAVIGLSVAHIVIAQRRLSRLGQAQMKQSRESQNRWIESLGCLPTLQSLGIQHLWSKRLTDQQIQQRMTSNEIRAEVFNSGQFTQALQQLGWVGIIALGAWLASNNELTVGGMIAASMLTMRCFAPIQKLQGQLILSHVAQSGFVELDEFITQSTPRPQASESLDSIQEIRLNQVNVSLGGPQPILQNLSMHFKAGDRVGLIGPNGSGKTTLLTTLAGIHPPSQGGYCINTLDSLKISPSEIGKKIGYAEQPPQLIEGSLLENIRMNRPWVTAQDCVDAVDQLSLTAWISNLPDGLHSKVQVSGKNLSSGKRQMISLARALASKPDLLLLDEPTVCLDKESESLVKKALARLPASTILIVATHSISLLESTDKLVMLEQGRIKAHGERTTVLSNVHKAQRES